LASRWKGVLAWSGRRAGICRIIDHISITFASKKCDPTSFFSLLKKLAAD